MNARPGNVFLPSSFVPRSSLFSLRSLSSVLLSSFFFLLFFSACASIHIPPHPERELRITQTFQKAEAYYRNQFYPRALETYQQVLAMDPKGQYAENCLYKIAGILMRQDHPEQAVVYFNRLAAEFPKSPFAEEAIYNKGFCYYKMDDPERALAAYKDYLALAEARNKTRVRVLASQSLDALGRYDEALGYLATAGALENDRDKQIEILQETKKLLERVPPARLPEILPSLKEGVISDYARFRAAQDASGAGDTDAARKFLSGIDFRRGRFQFYKDAQALSDTMSAQEGRKPAVAVVLEPPKPVPTLTVGVVLPLSGKFQVFGDQVIHGIMLGVDRQAQKDVGVKVEVLVRDSEGDSATAEKMVRELAALERVKAVIGPLLVKEADPAADAASQLGIPMLSLSRKEDLVKNRDWVFRNAVTFTHQARALISYASTHLRIRRFAVMYPQNEFGEAFKNAFAAQIDPSKMTVTVETGYAPDATDFKAQARAIADSGAEAVFIPDTADRVALLASQLVFYGVKDVELLGPSSWNDDGLAQKAGAYLKRAVLVDGFFAGASEPAVHDFSGKYIDQFGEKPTLLSALGYDSVGMLGRVVKSGNFDTREAVRRGLLNIRGYDGVTGTVSFFENGECDRTLTILRVGTEKIEMMY